jgi:hypothetical protein
MEFWLVFIGSALFILFIRGAWKAYTDPSDVLGRQGANMGWVIAGHEKDLEGYRNVVLSRGPNEAVISFVNGHVKLIKPYHGTPFKDFVELEPWLVKNGNAPSSTHPQSESSATVSPSEFMTFIESHGFKQKYLEVCKFDNDFGMAVSELRDAGRDTKASEKVIGLFVIDALHNYDKNPQFALSMIEGFTEQFLEDLDQEHEYSEFEKEDDEYNYHPDLDELNEEIANFLEDYALADYPIVSDWPVSIWSEIIAYLGSYTARLSVEQKIYDVEWNSFKASIENRILSSLENPQKLDGVEETPQGKAFVHYVSEYHNEMTTLEKLVINKKNSDGNTDFVPASEFLAVKILGEQGVSRSSRIEELLEQVESFSSDRIIPKVLKAFS